MCYHWTFDMHEKLFFLEALPYQRKHDVTKSQHVFPLGATVWPPPSSFPFISIAIFSRLCTMSCVDVLQIRNTSSDPIGNKTLHGSFKIRKKPREPDHHGDDGHDSATCMCTQEVSFHEYRSIISSFTECDRVQLRMNIHFNILNSNFRCNATESQWRMLLEWTSRMVFEVAIP